MSSGSSLHTLVDQATVGDPQAIDSLIDRYLPRLHAFIRLECPPQLRRLEQTADLAQSACREVLADLAGHKWVSEPRFRHWLFVCARSKLRDKIRYWHSEKRDPTREAAPPQGPDLTDFSWQAVLASYDHTPSRLAMAREDLERIEIAFAGLTDDQRHVILLSRLVGFTAREIGEEIGKTEVAVRKLLSRATARLVCAL